MVRDGNAFGSAEIALGLGRVMDAAGAASGADRAGQLIVRRGRIAAIERSRPGLHYFVLPGGGVEAGETSAQTARREAAEELGVRVSLGSLRVVAHTVWRDGSRQRHWCFDASTESEDIAVVGGPEVGGPPEHGTYRAVWLDLDEVASRDIWPSEPARLVAANRGRWPDGVIQTWES